MPSILIQDLTPRNQYTAAEDQTVFTFDFTVFAETDIEVYQRSDKDVQADDYSQQLQYNIDYTVNLTSGTITMLAPCSGEEIVTLVRNMPDERLNLYTNGTPLTADALNTDAESQVLMVQQARLGTDILSPHYNNSAIIDDANPLGGDTILPVLEAGQVWVKDPTNNYITAANLGSGGGGGDIQMLNAGITGAEKGAAAKWNSSGVLTDSGVIIDDNDAITGVTGLTAGDIRLAVTDPGTIDSSPGKPLKIKAAAGQALTLGELGANTTLNGLKIPTADGTAGQVLTTDGAGNLAFAASGGGAPFASTKFNLVQFSNTTGGLQDSGIDYQSGILSGMTEIDVGNLELSGNTISVGNTNGSLTLAPNGTGTVKVNTELDVRSGNELRFFRSNNTFYTGLKAGSPGANVTWTLPDADGTLNQVLTTNGAGTLAWTSGGGGGGGDWTQTGVVTAASNATIDMTGVFSSKYTRYMIVARNLTFQTATADLWIRVGTGATPTWKSGATDYAYSFSGYTSAAANLTGASTGASQIVLATNLSASTDLPTSFIINVFDPANAAYKTPILGEVEASNDGTTLAVNSHSSAYLTAEALTSIQFLASSGNIVTGEFEIYGFNPGGGGGGGGGGNVVYNNFTDSFHIPLGDIPGLFVKITPSSSTGKIKLTFEGHGIGGETAIQLKRNGVILTLNGITVGSYYNYGGGDNDAFSFTYVDSPATTTEVTYQIYSRERVFYPSGNYPSPLTLIAEEIGST